MRKCRIEAQIAFVIRDMMTFEAHGTAQISTVEWMKGNSCFVMRLSNIGITKAPERK